MKKVILIVLFIVSAVSLIFGFIKFKEYMDLPKNKTDIDGMNEKIKEVEKEIKDKDEELEKIKEENKEKIELVKEWQSKIEKIKSYM